MDIRHRVSKNFLETQLRVTSVNIPPLFRHIYIVSKTQSFYRTAVPDHPASAACSDKPTFHECGLAVGRINVRLKGSGLIRLPIYNQLPVQLTNSGDAPGRLLFSGADLS